MIQQPEHPTSNEPARYCCRCGYELRGLTSPRCPECGRAFDPANPKTFRCRPIRRWHWYVKCAAILLVTVAVLLAATWGWFFWGWYQERQVLVELEIPSATDVVYSPLISPWLKEHSGPAGFVLDRIVGVYAVNKIDITDISPLIHLQKLRELSLSRTKVTNFTPLIQLTNLEWLQLYDMSATDISPLARLTNLKTLMLYGTPVRDLSPLAGLMKLNFLDLRATKVTDLSPLTGLKSLRYLLLSQKTITEAQVKELQRALPDCEITLGG